MANNYQFIKSESGLSVSTLSLTDCFSDNYLMYQLIINKLDVSTTDYLHIRFIDSGGVISTNNYSYGRLNMLSSSATGGQERQSSVSYLRLGYVGTGSEVAGGFVHNIANPYISNSNTFMFGENSSNQTGNFLYGGKMVGMYDVASQITGVQLFMASATMNGIKATMFGIKWVH